MDEKKQAVYFKKVEDEPFAKLLNIKLKEVSEGYARCEMEYSEQMDNIYGSAHGGALFSLIDEAFEISSNSHENIAVALNMNVTYMRPPRKNTVLVAARHGPRGLPGAAPLPARQGSRPRRARPGVV